MQRRHFLFSTAAAALAAPPPQSGSPNDRIQIATIGLGNRGAYDTRQALKIPGVQLVAGSDLYSGRRERARELYGKDLFLSPDYNEVLARKDVDAVIVTTPDHWHAQASIDSMLAGKDVYCEKPMVHSIAEGHEVIATHRKSQRIMEVGSQRVSSVMYRKAQQLVQDGAIGHLNLIEASWDRPGDNDELAFRPSIAPDASTSTIDWDRFVSNTHKVPFDPKRFFWWHNYRDYGTGIPGDLFVHLFSGVNFVLQSNGPERVVSTGGTRFWKDGREIPDIMLALCDYPDRGTSSGVQSQSACEFRTGSRRELRFPFCRR